MHTHDTINCTHREAHYASAHVQAVINLMLPHVLPIEKTSAHAKAALAF